MNDNGKIKRCHLTKLRNLTLKELFNSNIDTNKVNRNGRITEKLRYMDIRKQNKLMFSDTRIDNPRLVGDLSGNSLT